MSLLASNTASSFHTSSSSSHQQHNSCVYQNCSLWNNRGVMWINEGLYDRAVESLQEAFKQVDVHPYDQDAEAGLSPEQEHHIGNHLVLHLPQSKRNNGVNSADNVLVYKHAVHLSQLDRHSSQSSAAAAPRAILEFNLALAYQLLAEDMIVRRDPAQDPTGAKIMAALDESLALYTSFVQRFLHHQQSAARAPSFLQYFLALASLNNMGYIYIALLQQRMEAAQCGSCLLDLHDHHNDATILRQQQQVDSNNATTPFDNSNLLFFSTTPAASLLSNDQQQHGMISYLDCFLEDARICVSFTMTVSCGGASLTDATVAASDTSSLSHDDYAYTNSSNNNNEDHQHHDDDMDEECWEYLGSAHHNKSNQTNE